MSMSAARREGWREAAGGRALLPDNGLMGMLVCASVLRRTIYLDRNRMDTGHARVFGIPVPYSGNVFKPRLPAYQCEFLSRCPPLPLPLSSLEFSLLGPILMFGCSDVGGGI